MTHLRCTPLAVVLSVLLAGCPAPVGESPAQTLPDPPDPAGEREYRVATVVDGLEHPWGMVFLPGDEGILVTERPGRLRWVRDGRLDPHPLEGLPEIRALGEGGLLDIALHPAFDENRFVYFAYSKPGDGGVTKALARGRFEDGRLTAVEDLFVADAWASTTVNYGGRIVFDHEGYLFLTIGDRRQEERAQDLGDHAGTTIRLHDDGRVPDDNPFVGRTDARDEIYAYGHRNPIGLIVHPGTGEIWQSDNGPSGGDRINRIVPGGNYGWPAVSFGNHYDGRRIPDPAPGDGTEMPAHFWNPSISPSGMTLYIGDAFPQWSGDLFLGSLQTRHLNRLRLEGTAIVAEERLLAERGERIRAVVTGPDGLLYLLVDAPDAPILRLEPTGSE